ncbi:MAG: MbtF [Desulfovibrionaceae bacterium]
MNLLLREETLMVRALLFCAGAALLAGCSSMNPWADENEPKVMTMEVDLQERHRCSRISPEITVRNVPEGTVAFQVRLEETSLPQRILGGGRWANDGSGVIPEGALTQHYQGACPQNGVPGKYMYVVAAMGADGQPLSVRTYSFTQE